jgi:hypothetical protein
MPLISSATASEAFTAPTEAVVVMLRPLSTCHSGLIVARVVLHHWRGTKETVVGRPQVYSASKYQALFSFCLDTNFRTAQSKQFAEA